MPRPKQRLARLSRDEVLILVKQLLERAGAQGMTKQELLTAIGPSRTSLATIQRCLDRLRDELGALITSFGKVRRWRIEAPLAMPLDAPEPEDLLAVLLAQAILEPYLEAPLLERIGKIVEELDERVRSRGSATNLPPRKAMTSTLTLGTRTDPVLVRRLYAACRRKAVRIRYASPWKPVATSARWHVIEPWALRVHDGAVYLRAWATGPGPAKARTFRVTHIEAVEPIDEPTKAASRRAPPADVWGDESPAFGIDRDRPGEATIRLRGAVARWVARTIWHPAQKDEWIVPGEVLERRVPYRSCRELARRLASVSDGIVSIEPAELRDEAVALVAPLALL